MVPQQSGYIGKIGEEKGFDTIVVAISIDTRRC
jgi:hypothetical protein